MQSDEDLLGGIPGVLAIQQEALRNPQDQPFVQDHNALERSLVARLRILQQAAKQALLHHEMAHPRNCHRNCHVCRRFRSSHSVYAGGTESVETKLQNYLTWGVSTTIPRPFSKFQVALS